MGLGEGPCPLNTAEIPDGVTSRLLRESSLGRDDFAALVSHTRCTQDFTFVRIVFNTA